MASTTAKWAIPQPDLADDPPDVPRDVHAATNRIDDLLTPLSRGLFAAIPPFGKLGQRYIATDQSNQEYLDIGTGWIPLNVSRGITTGDVKSSFQTADHGDWKLIDGRNNIPRTQVTQEYVDLAIARGWLGTDGTKIGVPDGLGRMLVMKGTHADIDALGDNDGNAAVGKRRPKHHHTVTEPNGGQGHNHGGFVGGIFPSALRVGYHTTLTFSGDDWTTNEGVLAQNYALTINRAVTGVLIGTDPESPLDGPAYLTVNFFIYVGATISGVGEGGTGGGSLQDPVAFDLATANLAAGAAQSGVVPMGAGWRMLKITADHPCRIRLYSTPAKRDADTARPATTDPPDYPTTNSNPNHGCMLEVILTAANLEAGSYVQYLAPNVIGSSGEEPRSNSIAYRVDNTDVAAHVINIEFLNQTLEAV